MTGLRERQKTRRRQAILEAAHRLFRERGYDGTSMEHISERAEVSLGTIYNYFDTKGAILLHIAGQHFHDRISAAWPDTADRARPPAAIIADFTDNLLDWGMEVLDRSLWRNVYSTSLLHVSQADERAYSNMDRYLQDEIIRLCIDLGAHGRLPRMVDPQALGEIAFAIGNNQWIQFLIYDAVSMAEAKQAIRRQLDDLLRWAGPALTRPEKGPRPAGRKPVGTRPRKASHAAAAIRR